MRVFPPLATFVVCATISTTGTVRFVGDLVFHEHAAPFNMDVALMVVGGLGAIALPIVLAIRLSYASDGKGTERPAPAAGAPPA